MENNNNCNNVQYLNEPSIFKPIGGAVLRGDNMQGRPKGEESCSVIESKITLPSRVEKCAPCPHTAYKYNGGQFDKFIVGLDYLCLNLVGSIPIAEGEEEYKGEEFQFLNEGSGTKHFKARFSVYYHAELLGILEAYPRPTKVTGENGIRLRIDNQLFFIMVVIFI